MRAALRERLAPIVRQADGTYQATILFDREFLGFKGHFPGRPIVPGVCEIALVELLAQLATGNGSLKIVRIEKMKFRAPLLPGDNATFDFSLNEAPEGEVIISATASTSENKKMAAIRLALK